MRSNSCPECQGSMVEGFVPGESNSMRTVSSWAEGAPQSRWYGVKLKGKAIPIQTWRCQRCGFLKQYARG